MSLVYQKKDQKDNTKLIMCGQYKRVQKKTVKWFTNVYVSEENQQ